MNDRTKGKQQKIAFFFDNLLTISRFRLTIIAVEEKLMP
jgi:hypothetical protein